MLFVVLELSEYSVISVRDKVTLVNTTSDTSDKKNWRVRQEPDG